MRLMIVALRGAWSEAWMGRGLSSYMRGFILGGGDRSLLSVEPIFAASERLMTTDMSVGGMVARGMVQTAQR